MLTDDFHREADGLLVPAMGTEEVGPLLYHLIRMVRPTRVLEVGMGFTTPFIARALSDNRQSARQGAMGLAAKSAAALREPAGLDDGWVRAEPALLEPAFHVRPHDPRFLAIDDLGGPGSSASRVLGVLEKLGLRDQVTVLPETLSKARDVMPPEFLPFDFLWLDIWEKIHLFDRYWDLVDPAGGLVLLHYMHGYAEGEEFLRSVRERQLAEPAEFEVTSILEPHKIRQNSLTIIRRVSGLATPATEPGSRLAAARTLVDQYVGG